MWYFWENSELDIGCLQSWVFNSTANLFMFCLILKKLKALYTYIIDCLLLIPYIVFYLLKRRHENRTSYEQMQSEHQPDF